MKVWAFLGIICYTLSAHSTECEQFGVKTKDFTRAEDIRSLPQPVIYHYAQFSPKQEDILGDYGLYVRATLTPKKILWTLLNKQKKLKESRQGSDTGRACALELFGDNPNEERHDLVEIPYTPEESDLEVIKNLAVTDEKKEELLIQLQMGKLYLEGHKNPIKVDRFVEMFNQIIKAEQEASGINPSLGTPHVWSKEFKKKFGFKYSPFLKMSKLLVALSRGETSRYMITGKENELRSWMLAQTIRSIVPHDLIRESYRLNQGDVYLTLLTIENILSSNWLNPSREKLDTTVRLKPFINSFGHEGDIYGSWYHSFGIMLYGYVRGGLSARVVGNIESLGSHILDNDEDEKQEDFINDRAALIGGRLKKSILKKEYQNLPTNEAVFDTNYYFDSSENFEKRLKKL